MAQQSKPGTSIIISLSSIIFVASLLPINVLAATQEKPTELRPEPLVPKPPPEALQAALKGKQSFSLLAKNDKLARELGFQSTATVIDSQTSLGSPFPIVRARIDLLRGFRLGTTNPLMMLEFGGEFIYPVTVDGQVRSSVTVTEIRSGIPSNTTWRTTEWGSQHLIQRLDAARKTISGPSSSFALLVPEVGQFFLGNQAGSTLFLIPLKSNPVLDLELGVPQAADVVFDKLASSPLVRTPNLGQKP